MLHYHVSTKTSSFLLQELEMQISHRLQLRQACRRLCLHQTFAPLWQKSANACGDLSVSLSSDTAYIPPVGSNDFKEKPAGRDGVLV